MKRHERRPLLLAQVACAFVMWISAGIYVNDCSTNATFKHDFDNAQPIEALSALGYQNIFAGLLLASLVAQLWLPQLTEERRTAGEGAIESITQLLTATARTLSNGSAIPEGVHVVGFFHLAVADYLMPVTAATSSGKYISDKKSVISISLTSGGLRPFVISRAFKSKVVLCEEQPVHRSEEERRYKVPDYRDIIGAPVFEYGDSTRPIGTISFGSDHPEAETHLALAEDTVERVASVVAHLWHLVGRRDPKIRELERELSQAIKDHANPEPVIDLPTVTGKDEIDTPGPAEPGPS
jgi:uncharacterized coiled-coil protein SlyX